MDLTDKIGVWVHVPEKVSGHLHELKSLGFDYIAIKITDGPHGYDPAGAVALARDAATIGLPVVCWGYFYPSEIDGQIAAVKAHLIPGTSDLILDIEEEWDRPGLAEMADELCHGIAEATGHQVSLHLSSFVNPSMHSAIPYETILSHCESFMPQCYQEGDTPIDVVIGRLKQQSVPMAKKSLGGKLIVTVNTAGMLGAVLATDVADGINVWLADGVVLPPGAVRPAGDDEGVLGYESSWGPAIAQVGK